MAPAVAPYEPRDPSRTVLDKVIAEHFVTFLASLGDDPEAKGLPAYVQHDCDDYVQCGILAHGFLRLGCDTCKPEMVLAFSCQRRGFCPSCAGRRMAPPTAHLVACVMPWVPTRQGVVSVPLPLRSWTAASQDLTATVHTIIRTTIAQYDVNQAVTHGMERQQVQPGSVTCIQRFGSALTLHVHSHLIFLEGVYLDRPDQGLTPRLVKAEPPSDADIVRVLQQLSRRVIRTRRPLGYLEAGIDAAVATGDDPLLDNEPERAHTMAASVTQRIACGERAGHKVRRIGSGCGDEGELPALTGPRCASMGGFSLHANTQVPAHRRDQWARLMRYTARGAVSLERLAAEANGDRVSSFTKPWSDGTTGITLSPLELLEKLAALVPLPRVHLVRYAGCLAPHSQRRGAIIPTPRQQGVEEDEAQTGTPSWRWARLLGRVFARARATCLPPLCGRREPCDLPLCRRGALRIIAAITQESVITRILRHRKLASVPPPIAPARSRQEQFDWVA